MGGEDKKVSSSGCILYAMNIPVALLDRGQINYLRQSVTKIEHCPHAYYRFRLRFKVGTAGYDRWLKDTFRDKK